MKVFIFERVQQVSSEWHPEGGLLIVAESVTRAKEMIAQRVYIEVTDEEWKDVIVIETRNYNESERLITFPDAGCC